MSKKIILSQEVIDAIVKNSKKAPFPEFKTPMLATLTKNYFSDKEWFYEQKFDGERCIAYKKNGHVTLYSRNGKIINTEYEELAAALKAQAADDFVIDGEIIATDKSGISRFQLLQSRINLQNGDSPVPISYCIFDILYTDGYLVEHIPLFARKELLKHLLKYNTMLKYTDHIVGKGVPLFHQACKKGEEGIMAKDSHGLYVHKRSVSWLKFKCSASQELVIGGYTKPKGSRAHFGALLVGYYDKKHFIYAGKVGTGFSEETLALLGKKLEKITTTTCPFYQFDDSTKDVVWVKPHIVAEFEFAEWTQGGKLRVGRYKGLREDKSAQDVVRESPKK